jgi:hypothetical protein
MCTFHSDLQTTEKSKNSRKSPITLFLRPNDKNVLTERYRFRILNFTASSKSDRTNAFISRYVHNHWSKNEAGKNIIDDTVVCPISQHVHARDDASLGFSDVFAELKLRNKKPTAENICPICKRYSEAWNIYNSSGHKDKLAQERIRALKRQFQGVVPVYVINDPVNETNNGRFKCIIFNNSDEYKHLLNTIKEEMTKIAVAKRNGQPYDWCNGDNAVDLYLRVDDVPVVYNEGKPTERHSTIRKITAINFGKNPYTLKDSNDNPIITSEAIDRFEFDEQYFTRNTLSELEDFYKRHYTVVNPDIPDVSMDLDFTVTATAPKVEKTKIPSNTVKAKTDDIGEMELNELNLDSETFPPFNPKENNDLKKDDEDLDFSMESVEDVMKELELD